MKPLEIGPFPNPEDDGSDDFFVFTILEKLRDRAKTLCEGEVVGRINYQCFCSNNISYKKILSTMQEIDNTMAHKIKKKPKLKAIFESQELTTELDWSLPTLAQPSSLIEEPSVQIIVLNNDYLQNKEKYSNNSREYLLWKKQMTVAETLEYVRKARDLLDCYNILFIHFQHYLKVIHRNGVPLIRKLRIFYAFYNLPSKHLDKFLLAITEIGLWPGLENEKRTRDSCANNCLKLETMVNDLQKFIAGKDNREALDNFFPINPWVAFELQGATNSLNQLQKTEEDFSKLLDGLVSLDALLSMEVQADFLKISLSPIYRDIHYRG